MEAIPFILFILVWIFLYKYLVNKKQKGKIVSHLLSFMAATVVMFLSIIPIAPELTTEQKAQIAEEKVIEDLESGKQNKYAEIKKNNPELLGIRDINKNELGDKWPLKFNTAIISCYKDNVAIMPVVTVNGKNYGLTGWADMRYGQEDINALNEVWLKDPKTEGLYIDLGPITDKAEELCN